MQIEQAATMVTPGFIVWSETQTSCLPALDSAFLNNVSIRLLKSFLTLS